MRSKLIYLILTVVLVAGCMFAVTNKAQTPVSSAGSSLDYVPVLGSSGPGQSPSAFPLSEETLKQIAVVGTIILMLFLILKNQRLPKQ